MRLTFRESGRKSLLLLPQEVQVRIMKKIEFFLKQENPLDSAEHLHEFDFGEYRFRVGEYRVVFDVLPDEQKKNQKKMVVHKVGHRKDVYR